MDLNNFKNYDGRVLNNASVSIKIDGVRVHVENGKHLSRAGKPLYNLPNVKDGVYEAFKTDFDTTSAITRTKNNPTLVIHESEMFRIDCPDKLHIGKFKSLTEAEISEMFKNVCTMGYEGLVISADEGLFKVKQSYTFDVKITKIIEGRGKFLGTMGSVMTSMGKVGTGFTVKDRDLIWRSGLGCTIEVECMQLTSKQKFRHARFVRFRPDKD